MNAPDHEFIRRFVKERAAIVLDANKGYLIDTRLLSVCQAHSFEGLSELVTALRARPSGDLAQDVVEALTTNETSFYRDTSYYEALRDQVIPELIERRSAARSLNVWSAAASTGQEPYSLAMMLADHPELDRWDVKILATDIDEKVLARAREGEFSRHEVNRGLPAADLKRHFEERDGGYRIRDSLKERIEFRQMNLAARWPPMEAMDLVLIRNVLIYFDTATKKTILSRAHGALRRGGYLLLGGAETTLNLTDEFDRVKVGRAVMYRVAA